MGATLASKIRPIWGLTDEGEIRGVWRNCGLPNFYYMMGMFFLQDLKRRNAHLFPRHIGNLALSRFHSAHIALRK